MMYLSYISLVVLVPFVMVLNVLLSPILPIFIRGGHLPKYLSWFAPADSPAWGSKS